MPQPTIAVLDKDGVARTIFSINPNGRAAAADSGPVALSTEDLAAINTIATAIAANLKVGTTIVQSGQAVTRPANTTAYSQNDVIGTATSHVIQLDNVARINAGSGYLTKVVLSTNQPTCVAQIRVHLYRVAPTAIADNAPMALLYADEANYLGFIDMPALSQEGTGSTMAQSTLMTQFPFLAGAGVMYLIAVLETKTAFTPDSGQQFKIRVTSDQN